MIKRFKAAWLAFKYPEIVEVKDELTGALTRKAFFREANRELARAKREQREISFVSIDLDNLKEINDIKGHKQGDFYLKKFANIILENIRPYDVFARIGGDEFILLLPGVKPAEARKTMRRIYLIFPEFSWGD
jgi:diguanylate cyclase (GGDEF)-like protein